MEGKREEGGEKGKSVVGAFQVASDCFNLLQVASCRLESWALRLSEALAPVEPARVMGCMDSRGPGQKVSVQLQAIVSTLFRVELGRENIIARNGRGKGCAVVSFPYSVAHF